MTNEAQDPRENSDENRDDSPLPMWKKLLAVLSLALGGVGLAFGGASSGEAQPDPAAGGSSLVQPSALGANGASSLSFPEVPAQETEPETLWAPLLAKGGLSFFVAFCIGYALRTFLRGTMLVIGVVALAIFGLQKAGVLGEVDWERAQGYWDDLTANLGSQFESLKTFVTGSVPSAASGSVGLIAGFKR